MCKIADDPYRQRGTRPAARTVRVVSSRFSACGGAGKAADAIGTYH
jgi:hypothetical protein